MIKLVDFQSDLLKKDLEEVVQKYLFDGFPFCFQEDPGVFYDFRKNVCDNFRIHQQNFAIVGSAKVGFSLSPEKYGNSFSDSSDIDIVLVSDELFEELWLKLIEFKHTTLFRLDSTIQIRFQQLQKMLFYGTIRFDKLTNDFPVAKEWWEYFNKVSKDERFGPRRVRAAFFKGWKHVSYYYEESLRKLRQTL
ncbi:MAG: hypothetical protein JXM79_18190 [Sedimentisphaerales bacterium]|nr:hypothetical protein [Sedimentisphaerales bacterium]